MDANKQGSKGKGVSAQELHQAGGRRGSAAGPAVVGIQMMLKRASMDRHTRAIGNDAGNGVSRALARHIKALRVSD